MNAADCGTGLPTGTDTDLDTDLDTGPGIGSGAGRSVDLDLGEHVTAVYTSHGLHDRAGLVEWHPCDGGTCRDPETGAPGRCGGSILFDLPGIRETFPGRDVWTVESFDPLTLSPSIACGCRGCRHHGFIRNGRWVPV